MERIETNFRMALVSRASALAMAVVATSLIFTSTTVILTSGAQAHAASGSQVAQASVSALAQV